VCVSQPHLEALWPTLQNGRLPVQCSHVSELVGHTEQLEHVTCSYSTGEGAQPAGCHLLYSVEPATLRGVTSRDRRDGANGRYTGQTLHLFCSTGTKYVLSVVVELPGVRPMRMLFAELHTKYNSIFLKKRGTYQFVTATTD
jgi:hypothetical protein